MDRLYADLIKEHLHDYQEMVFLSGPRQVGKTTVAKVFSPGVTYLNWDNEDHRRCILDGPRAVFDYVGLAEAATHKKTITFDEIHKHPDWKNFLKGFYDQYSVDANILVTGSARLDVYKKGGDSLMGRYFSYRMHPLSVAEVISPALKSTEISVPNKIADAEYAALWEFGGFPKPFISRNKSFSTRWQSMRRQQLVQEDIRDVQVIHELNKLQILMDTVRYHSSNQITFSTLAKHVRVSVDTVSRWLEILGSFYYCFLIKPWSTNIPRALIKEPKIFLYDWSVVDEPGARAETFIAAHLLKAVQHWTDIGLGEYGLHYIRTTEKKEVDFIVTKNDKPWFLVEVKHDDSQRLSAELGEFQKKTGAEHAFQVVVQANYVDVDCFSYTKPVIVPARTLLSQLV